jgi:hypothetical protein
MQEIPLAFFSKPKPFHQKILGNKKRKEKEEKNIKGADLRNRQREGGQKEVGFFIFAFLARRAPHSEAFFTSVIQVMSGIRYRDAGLFPWPGFSFFKKFLKIPFMVPSLSGVMNFQLFKQLLMVVSLPANDNMNSIYVCYTRRRALHTFLCRLSEN